MAKLLYSSARFWLGIAMIFLVGSVCANTGDYKVTKIPTSELAQSVLIHGIYINSSTALNMKKLKRLASKSKQVGINAFIMNYVPRSARYRRNVKWVQAQGLQYIPRIVMYPGGATHAQITSKAIFNDRMQQIHAVIDLGAKDVQLDYIRYSSKSASSPSNAVAVANVLDKIDHALRKEGVDVQVDVFGVAAHGPSHRIGQDVRLMANHVEAICPMVYPSHYEPYLEHSQNPYRTIYGSLNALVKQLHEHDHVRVYPYIESYNYRYPMNTAQRQSYIREELRAVNDSHADGWMVWSANNVYGNLFRVLGGPNA